MASLWLLWHCCGIAVALLWCCCGAAVAAVRGAWRCGLESSQAIGKQFWAEKGNKQAILGRKNKLWLLCVVRGCAVLCVAVRFPAATHDTPSQSGRQDM